MAEALVSVAVLGAAGTIAPAIIHDLGVSRKVASMVLLGRRGAAEHGFVSRQPRRDAGLPAGGV
jgi:hypothetical protein